MTCHRPNCSCTGDLPAIDRELRHPVSLQMLGLVVALVGVCGAVVVVL